MPAEALPPVPKIEKSTDTPPRNVVVTPKVCDAVAPPVPPPQSLPPTLVKVVWQSAGTAGPQPVGAQPGSSVGGVSAQSSLPEGIGVGGLQSATSGSVPPDCCTGGGKFGA